ncbi:hypothetical protein JVT61DRAFT_8877 [Boletus reticuloceps]|uniref:Arrestin C-terminal-like domain-containing protein n=1 Tax=Boletus reticuloceps TaxID=495285 RepID=A0A8I2YIB6_9AGAM|nr:hypothetical protein JVT61DRAFT_8877 [Boletus reticuloceps]
MAGLQCAAIEVRVGPAGAKAKWVRVELKKIETLPGGGQANSYFDHVGPSPITLWQSGEDYSVLQSQDLPFLIRIPESIPPSIALDRGGELMSRIVQLFIEMLRAAGIRYELVATVCTLGKQGFFRRRKAAVLSQATTIIIDKHELHSTWPVYSQPESRSVHQDGVHLTVERDRTCYGPGDRVSVMALLKSDAVHPVVLRGFEFTLRETTIFRAGPQATAKRSGPQSKTANIGEQKVPLSVTLYNGMQHKAELGCLIPNTHTTTTLNAARHIDITYVIVARAWIGQMQSVTMELPVIVSNWPRRIGLAPSLCVASPSSPAATVPITTSIVRPQTGDSSHRVSAFNEFGSTPTPAPPKQSIHRTAPTGHNGTANTQLDADELGALGSSSGARATATVDHPGYGSSRRPGSRGGLGGIQENSVLSGTGAEGSQVVPEARVGRRRPSANAQQNRLTITNISEKDAEEGITAMPAPRATQKAWPTAENEKAKLYENAVLRVQQVQGPAAMGSATTASDMPTNLTSTPSITSKKSAAWPTAETEKVRLYEHAQATVKRTQAFGVSSTSTHSRSSSDANSPGSRDKQFSTTVVPGPSISAGAALYQQAVSSISSNANNGPSTPNNRVTSPSPPSSASRIPHYPSAEEEKAALKRYHEAKLAVDRNQNVQYGSPGAGSSAAGATPASYDSLFPEPNGQDHASGSDMPPPFESSGSSSQPHYLNEKERLRRQYEARDAAALAAQPQAQAQIRDHASSPSHSADAPAYAGPRPEDNGLSEKEILRRRLDEQDRVAQLLQQQQQQQQHYEELEQPQALPRVNGTRAPPVPPTMNGFKPLTAAEEKALLRARYEAEEQATVNGYAEDAPPSRHPYATAIPTTEVPPPPLMPRPPADYIQETQEADVRGRYYDSLGVGLASALDTLTPVPPRIASPVFNPRLDVPPFSPFDAGLGYDLRAAMASPKPSHGHAQPPPPPPPAAQY